jgi:hypothetical protein
LRVLSLPPEDDPRRDAGLAKTLTGTGLRADDRCRLLECIAHGSRACGKVT